MPDSASHSDDSSRSRGTITLIRGCMFSGKTTELLRRLAGHDAGSYSLFKHVIDDRYASDAVVSHMGQVLPARKIAAAREIHGFLEATRRPSEPRAIRATEEGARMTGPAPNLEMDHQCDDTPILLDQSLLTVAIDEGHFFDEELVHVVRDLRDRGVACLITALDRDSWANPFPQINRLSDLADEDIVLHTTCAKCGEQANRTQRLTPVTDTNMVGGPESYEPRCPTCWTPPVVHAY